MVPCAESKKSAASFWVWKVVQSWSLFQRPKKHFETRARLGVCSGVCLGGDDNAGSSEAQGCSSCSSLDFSSDSSSDSSMVSSSDFSSGSSSWGIKLARVSRVSRVSRCS